MFPWFWFWAPQYHFPLSGSVAQRIEPDLFDAIPVQAGNGEVEREIFDVASYGRQLGLITEVLLAQAGRGEVTPELASESLARMEKIRCDIEAIKCRHTEQVARSAVAVLEKLQASDPDQLARVLARFAPGPALLTHQASPNP